MNCRPSQLTTVHKLAARTSVKKSKAKVKKVMLNSLRLTKQRVWCATLQDAVTVEKLVGKNVLENGTIKFCFVLPPLSSDPV